jgi:hypothetical protein
MSKEIEDDKYPLLSMDDFKSIIITLANELTELKQKPLK